MDQAKPFSISKQVVWEAYKEVKANRGTAGVDSESIEEFEKDLKNKLYKIWNRMSSGTYFPPPVRTVAIPKKDGGQRRLGIPTVGDRIAQTVVKKYLEPEVEPHFHPDSYGYRPGKSALAAVGTARERCWRYNWVIDLDIRGFFDNLDHALVMRAVGKYTQSRWILLYVERWLKAPIQLEEGTLVEREKGTPQGGVASPLLANIFLHLAFDEWMRSKHPEAPFERNADDIVVHCKREEQAQQILKDIEKRLAQCKLELHPEKTKIVYCKDDDRRGTYANEKFDFFRVHVSSTAVEESMGKALHQLQPGQKNTEAFWKEIAERGAPVFEPFGSDGKYQLVTFLWRSTHATRNVLVIGSFGGVGAPEAYSMHQIPDSDVWYLTLKLPNGARFTYQLSPNDPMTFDGPRAAERAVTRQADPLNLNPLSQCPPNTSKFRCQSVAELPGAAPQPWIISKPGTPEGRLEKQTIKSNIQRIDRPFSVYTPANYKADGPPNALLIMFDGEDLSSDRYPVTTLNNLIAASKIPATVAVFVENIPHRRLVDLVANPEFADFLAAELVPWIRAHYNVRKEASKVVVGGYSAGGLAAPYLALRHPEVFGNVLSESGAFWWSPEHNGGICGARCPDSGGRGGDGSRDSTTEGNFLVKHFLASSKLPVRFYLAAGTFESDRDGGGGEILEGARHLRDVLRAKGYEVQSQQFVGGHDGLRSVFAWPVVRPSARFSKLHKRLR